MSKPILVVLLLVGLLPMLYAQPIISRSSPDKFIVVSMRNTPAGAISYQLTHKAQPVIEPSTLGFGWALS